jgi:hypothetical protein
MSRFQLFVNTDNEAFQDDPSTELVRILRDVASRIECGDMYDMFRTILDVNGNDVGGFALKPDDYR